MFMYFYLHAFFYGGKMKSRLLMVLPTIFVSALLLQSPAAKLSKSAVESTGLKDDPATCILEPKEQSGIGDIKFSILSEADFQKVNGTEWVLMKGQSVGGITYPGYTGELLGDIVNDQNSDYEGGLANIPDTGGKFLRARNTVASDSAQNPSGILKLGAYQADAMQDHRHYYDLPKQGGGVPGGGAYTGGGGLDTMYSSYVVPSNGYPRLSNESRSKNITVNMFVKIRRACIKGSIENKITENKLDIQKLLCGPSDLTTYPDGCFALPESSETEQHAKVTCIKSGLDEWELDNAKKYWSHNCLVQSVAMGKRILLSLGSNRTGEEETWYDHIVMTYPYYNHIPVSAE
jgi:hypothetical protein